jgi:hypothetical protein
VAGEDVLHFKNGTVLPCEIEALTDNIVTFTFQVGEGKGKRTLPVEQISHVVFGFETGEEADFREREELSSDELENWWDFHFAHLDRPRSRTAAWGIALGHALLREDPESKGKEALALFDRISGRAWSEEDVALAKQGRLRALIALGELETAMGEAKILAGQTEDPELLIEVKHLLADADFAALEALEEEHPRWSEDDEVRPQREDLYHRVIDQYLWPHLFHATRVEAAARGLLAAGRVYEFGNEVESAKHAYTDLLQLYPSTEAVSVAEERLKALSQPKDQSLQANP